MADWSFLQDLNVNINECADETQLISEKFYTIIEDIPLGWSGDASEVYVEGLLRQHEKLQNLNKLLSYLQIEVLQRITILREVAEAEERANKK